MWMYRPPTERFFDADRRRQIDALFDAILPGTKESPGAKDVDAGEYLDRLLAMDESTYYEIPEWRELYSEALPALDEASRSLHEGRSVAELGREEVTRFLRQLSEGSLSGMKETMQKRLFSLLRNHCIEGAFADPRWGGNRDGQMWSWYGYLKSAEPFQRFGGPGTPMGMTE
jgi:gluconate 2-dehydrogenase gamma chain